MSKMTSAQAVFESQAAAILSLPVLHELRVLTANESFPRGEYYTPRDVARHLNGSQCAMSVYLLARSLRRVDKYHFVSLVACAIEAHLKAGLLEGCVHEFRFHPELDLATIA